MGSNSSSSRAGSEPKYSVYGSSPSQHSRDLILCLCLLLGGVRYQCKHIMSDMGIQDSIREEIPERRVMPFQWKNIWGDMGAKYGAREETTERGVMQHQSVTPKVAFTRKRH